jgi:hypothetical protein
MRGNGRVEKEEMSSMADQKVSRPRSDKRGKEETVVVPDAPGPGMAPPGAEATATEQAGGAVGTSQPTKSPTDAGVAAAIETGAEARPTLEPPAAGEAATVQAAGGVTATWQAGTIGATWSANEVRNAYMYVNSVGWKKIYNGRDGAFTALVTLATQARQTGRQITYRLEADGMVHEIYLW